MNLTLTERDKKLLGLTACLAILAVFGVASHPPGARRAGSAGRRI